MKYLTKTEKQTFNLGKKFAQSLTGGEVILLEGNLGSGKTVFSKGLAAGLGIKKVVTSPTFVLFKVYPVTRNQKIKKSKNQIDYFVHADCYRLKNGGDILSAGLKDYLNRPDAVVAVEWGERLGNLSIPFSRVVFQLTKKGRKIEVNKSKNQ